MPDLTVIISEIRMGLADALVPALVLVGVVGLAYVAHVAWRVARARR